MEELPVVPVSVNYFPHRQCNYSCEFCFHTTKNLKILPLEEAKRGMAMLAAAGMKKMNISGGEPFLQARFIGELFKYCKEDLGIESCSVVNNGSKVTEKWLDTYGKYLDFMAISIDSFDPETNIQLGRSDKSLGDNSSAKSASKDHIQRVFQVAEWCRRRGIMVKLNSVITKLNHLEDMNEAIEELNPFRWKVFQVLILKGENDGADSNSLRDGRKLVVSDEQFKAFLERHKNQQSLVPEDNETMKDSYLLLDEDLCFLNCQGGDKKPGRSVLEVGVAEALKDAGFDEKTFMNRGGVFEWSRDEEAQRIANEMDW
ncbi:radical SAM enzyme [Schizopora paradoxa]|uniref:Radical SAM enzyme n=1 Tax=Schizopora paradoxa TaxID=27342 RepID=A0A0H2RSC4_9AGAM|nr:radical SAM enzyme [Schizopora paradoxa]